MLAARRVSFASTLLLVILVLTATDAKPASPAGGEWRGHDLFAGSLRSKGWASGSKLQSSGLFFRWAEGSWMQLGFNHPFGECARVSGWVCSHDRSAQFYGHP
jgi:hypothetical protein